MSEEEQIEETQTEKETEEKFYEYGGPTSFEEIDAAVQAMNMSDKMENTLHQFSMIAHNIIRNPEVEDKADSLQRQAAELTKRIADIKPEEEKTLFEKALEWFKARPSRKEDGATLYASDFAYVPDKNDPETWKLPLAEERSGNITKAQLGRAAAAFSPGGFRGNKVQIPSGAVAGVKARIRREYKKLGVKPDAIPDSVKSAPPFMLWKEGDNWRWMATYSNKFRDRDNPPEILSSDAHKEFIESVDDGEWEFPALWLFHVKGTEWGKTDWLYYDEDTGFSLAAGYVTDEEIASRVCEMEDLAVSHGMPTKEIRRSEEDPTIITRYRSREISVVPRNRAANLLTDFSLDGGTDMIPEEKKEFLRRAGYSDERIAEIEDGMKAGADKAAKMGLEFKETPDVEEKQEEETTEAVSEDVPADPVEETPLTRAEIAEAFEQLAERFVKTIDLLSEKIDVLSAEVNTLKESDDEKIEQTVAATPAASLTDILRAKSVIGSEETRVDGRVSLARSKPKETEPKRKGATGIGFIDQFMPTVAD